MGPGVAWALVGLLGVLEPGVDGDAERGPPAPRRVTPRRRPIADPEVAVARVTTSRRTVALTFDACATTHQRNGFDRPVFEILKRHRIPTTIFVTGRWLEYHPDEAREISAQPWVEIGNHSYSHQHLLSAPAPRLSQEIAKTEALIAKLGRSSVAFRPPGGQFDSRTVRAAAEHSLPTVLWDVVSGDAGGHLSAATMVKSVLASAKPGSIIIFHINGRGPHTSAALPGIIAGLRKKGLRFVFLSELLKTPGARLVRARPDLPGVRQERRPLDRDRADPAEVNEPIARRRPARSAG